MKILVVFMVSSIFLVQGIPMKPPIGTATDKLEGLPWVKAPKGKVRFGTTPPPQVEPRTEASLGQSQPIDSPPLVLTNQMLQDYIVALTASLKPYVVDSPDSSDSETGYAPQSPPSNVGSTPFKKPVKGKVPKQVDPAEEPSTTLSYWDAERKMYPDSFYDEFYMDWLRKRQVEELPTVATPNPSEIAYSESLETNEAAPQQPTHPAPAPLVQPYPSVPLSFSPYLMNPFIYPLAGMKISKAMAQAQVNAQLAALNITTTPKPIKIKLKIPIPPGSDLAQVVSSGIAGFPAGTTYELSKKK